MIFKTQNNVCLFVCVCVCVYIYIYTHTHTHTHTHTRFIVFLWRCSPKRDNHTRYDSSGRGIGSSQRPLSDNTHNIQISMPPVPTIPSCEQPQTNAFHRAATGIGAYIWILKLWFFLVSRLFRGTQFGKCYTGPIVNCTLTSRVVITANV